MLYLNTKLSTTQVFLRFMQKKVTKKNPNMVISQDTIRTFLAKTFLILLFEKNHS